MARNWFFRVTARSISLGGTFCSLTRPCGYHGDHLPVKKVQHPVLLALQTHPKFIDTVTQKVGFRAAQFMPQHFQPGETASICPALWPEACPASRATARCRTHPENRQPCPPWQGTALTQSVAQGVFAFPRKAKGFCRITRCLSKKLMQGTLRLSPCSIKARSSPPGFYSTTNR